MFKPIRAALFAAVLVIVPASLAGAAVHPADVARLLRPTLPGTHSVTAQMRRAGARFEAHRRLVRRNVALAGRVRRARGAKLPQGYALRVERWSIAHLRADNARLATALGSSGASAPASTPAAGPLQAIAQCESGGNPSAVGGGGTYRGLYQFDQQTWASVGGTGDPAAASPAEQTRRASILYSRTGATSWPVCGK